MEVQIHLKAPVQTGRSVDEVNVRFVHECDLLLFVDVLNVDALEQHGRSGIGEVLDLLQSEPFNGFVVVPLLEALIDCQAEHQREWRNSMRKVGDRLHFAFERLVVVAAGCCEAHEGSADGTGGQPSEFDGEQGPS